MVIAFQVILLVVIVVSFFGAIGEKKDKQLATNLALICIAGMAAFICSVIWL